MVMHRKVLRAIALPFRAAWILILIVTFLLVSAASVLVAAFIGYGIALTFSYVFLPTEWTATLWQWAADLYDGSPWFKAATITFFVLLFLPILRLWPGRDPIADAARQRESMRLNDDLIAARRRGQL